MSQAQIEGLLMQPLQLYKDFIDGLVGISDSIAAGRVRQGLWQRIDTSHKRPRYPLIAALADENDARNLARNRLLEGFSGSVREEVATLLQEERTGGIHDFLAYLQEHGYSLYRGEAPLATEPFGTEPYFDYVARLKGDPWPDSA